MMSNRVNDRTVNDYDFTWALSLLRRSGVVDRIDHWNKQDCNTITVPYTTEAVLVAMLLLVTENEQFHWKQAAQLVAVRLSDAQLAALGLVEAVNQVDRRLLRRHAKYRAEDSGQVKKAQGRIYAAFMRSVNAVIEPLDGSPFRGSRRSRMTSSDVKAIRRTRTPLHDMRDARLDQVLNLLVRASVPVLTDGWAGSIVLDTTIIPSARSTRKYFDARPQKLHGPDPDAGWWHKDKYHDKNGVYGYGLTIVKTMPMPEHDNASLALSVAWHEPNGGNSHVGLAAIDAGRVSGAIAPKSARHKEKHRVVVTDMGFSEKLDFKPGAQDRGYQVIHDYSKNSINTATDIGKGVVLFRGAPVCVGAHSLIEDYQKLASKGVDADTRQARLLAIEELQMVRRGLPQTVVKRPPGRPRKGASLEPETRHQVTFRCPAAAGRVFCSLACSELDEGEARRADMAQKEALALDQGKPIMPNPPTPSTAPTVCDRDSTSFSLDAHQYKRWQVAMVGTEKHERIGKGGRSADEAFHGFMKSGVGAQFREDRFLLVTGPAVAIFTAMVVAVVNQSLLETHDLHTRLDPTEDDAA